MKKPRFVCCCFYEMGTMPMMTPPKPAPDVTPKIAIMPDSLLDPLLRALSIMSLEVRASVRAAEGKPEEAKDLFATAEKEEKALGYREPPQYIRPVGEAEGAAMLTIGRWPDAKAAFGRALVSRPHSGFARYGIALANERSGNREAAVESYADFLTAWKDADPALPQIARARAYLAAHRE